MKGRTDAASLLRNVPVLGLPGAGLEVLVHGGARLAARPHREDPGRGADHDVAAGEDPLLARLPGLLVGEDVSPLVRVEPGCGRRYERIGAVPDRHDHGVYR